MTIRGILFDKDGTLVDFFATWIPAYRSAVTVAAEIAGDVALVDRLLRCTGYDPATGELDPQSLLAGGTTTQICDAWADAAGIVERAPFVRRVHDAMDDYAARHPVPVADGVDVLFRRLRGRGYALGIATMDSEFVARATAQAMGLCDSIGFLCGYDSGHGIKPEPGMVHGFCAATDLAPANVLVVGDTDRDMGMARAAGVGMAVAVLTGATPAAALHALADRVIDSIMDIEVLLAD